MPAPTLWDVATLAGVSDATVSIALSNKVTTRVSAKKRLEILNIAKKIGYVPNAVAKALAERRTRLLGLMVPLRDPIFSNQFMVQALSGIQSTLMRRGYNLLVYSPSGYPGLATSDRILETKFTDGLIFINTRSCSTSDVNETIRELDAAGIKFAMINSYYGRASINYVGVDDFALGKAAAHHLLDRGHKHFAFLSGFQTQPAHIHLLRGMKRAVSERGLSFAPENVGCTNYDRQQAFEVIDKWLNFKQQRPTAIFCADEQVLIYLYEYAEIRSLSLPQDMSVLGRGNSEFISLLRPHPTAFSIPTFGMGELAADMLIDSIEKLVTTRRRVLLPFEFCQGQTT